MSPDAVPDLRDLTQLDDAELSAIYEPPDRTWLRVNFVSTLDGAAQGADGLSKSINNSADHRVFRLLRQQADVLIVGAGTLRAEEYDTPTLPLVVVSRSGRVPEHLRDAPEGLITMATVSAAPGLADSLNLLGADSVLVTGEQEVDLPGLKESLAGRGWVAQLCEGGPTLHRAMLEADVVDELCLTWVPRMIAGDHLRITHGAAVDVELQLLSLLHQQGTLLGRWRIH